MLERCITLVEDPKVVCICGAEGQSLERCAELLEHGVVVGQLLDVGVELMDGVTCDQNIALDLPKPIIQVLLDAHGAALYGFLSTATQHRQTIEEWIQRE